jgi:autotransporter-associated beta strand protein
VPADTTRIDSSVHLGSDPLIKQGPGTLVLSAANLHAGGTIVEEGTLVVRNLNALGQGGVQVRAGATLVLDGGGGRFTVPSLTLDPAGRIDVGMSQLSIRSGFSRAALLAAINTAKGDDGKWTGTSGIGSSVVEAMVAEGTNRTLGWLGWVDNGDASFTVGFAAAGDSNLDGCVDVTDIGNILEQMQGDSTEPATWNAGDFNHDEAVDVVDFADLIAVGVPLLDTGSYLPAPPPAAPENLRAASVSTSSVMLSWSTTDAPAGYEIEQSADGVRNWWPVAPSATQINGTSATISGLKPGERAFFRLRAFAERPSWWWDDRYRSADTAAVAATAMPSAPRNVNAWPVGATSAMVEWTPGLGLRTGTVVERQRVGSPEWVYVGTTPSWYARGLIDNGVEPNQSYMYRVRAVSHTALSDLAISAKPLAMPPEEPPVIDPPSDRDGDGVSDLDEIGRGLNPDSADTDGDGVDDGDEDNGGSDPSDPGSVARNDPWKARVEFVGRYGYPYAERSYEEQVKETKTLRLPDSIPVPATLIARWAADDAVRVNGVMLGRGYKDSGSKIITVSSRAITVDLVDTLGGEWGGWVELAVPAVDLDVDSDNDGVAQRSAAEDAIEDIAGIDATPGKVLLVNDQDTDNDGIQDFFDGFNAFASLDEDDLLGNASFTPLSLTLAGLPTNTPVTLDYSGSDPSILIEDSTGRLVPAPGQLRVWTVDATLRRSASELRAGGHYVPPGTYLLQELGITSGQTLTLYVEAIRPSVTTGDLSVTVSVPATPLSDRVRFTSTQFTVLGKALDEPFQESGFFISSTLPSPAAIGQDGIMAGAYREYRVQINDPRTTTTSVQIAGASLPLSRSGNTLESPTFVLIAPGATAHPTLRSIEASGSVVSWAFNPRGERRLVTSFQLTEWDTELAGIIVDVIKQMDGTWRPSNPGNPGEFGNVVHQRVGERLKGRAGWAVDVYVRNRTNEIVSIGTPPPNRTDTTQIDALKLKPGYTLEGKQFLDYTQIDDLYDVKTTASGIPDPEQAERLKSVLNGWQPGGQRSIKVGMVERRWVASAGWVDNVRCKNAIGLVRMIGLAAGVAQTAETAHAMWTFKDDDAELQALLAKAQKVKDGTYQKGLIRSEQRALFIKLEVNPFLKRRFGDSAVLDLADELAFRTFLTELQ